MFKLLRFSSRYVLAIYNNHELKHLWGEDRDVTIDNGSVLVNQNPKLCRVDYKALNRSTIGSGNSLIGDCKFREN